ncbi:MAG: hypothetical protein NDI94_06060 [Candidatus Woesearchaeota archaeon]|nr:hypothetical protein [Candidatus Woesearchaeota archaeon]
MVDVKCARCGKSVPAEDFVLDHRYKTVVCPACAKERTPAPKEPTAEPKHQEPIGHKLEVYHDDSHADKHDALRPDASGEDKIKVRCRKCKFEFKYNKLLKTPTRCPYFNTEVVFK